MLKKSFFTLFNHFFVSVLTGILFLVGNFLIFEGENNYFYIFFNYSISFFSLILYFLISMYLFSESSVKESLLSVIIFPFLGITLWIVLQILNFHGVEWLIFSLFNMTMFPAIFLILNNLSIDSPELMNAILLLSLLPPTLFMFLGVYAKK